MSLTCTVDTHVHIRPKKKSVQNPLTSLGHFLVYYIKTTHLNPQFMTQRYGLYLFRRVKAVR